MQNPLWGVCKREVRIQNTGVRITEHVARERVPILNSEFWLLNTALAEPTKEVLQAPQKGMPFASMRKTLLDDLPRRVAACDHLDRGAESILLNVAHASSSWAPKERIVYLGNASGSALECAACLDIFVARFVARFVGSSSSAA